MSGVILPGSRRKPPTLNDVTEPYDRHELQRRILEALQAGPLEKWRLREQLAAADVKVIKELTTLRQAGKVKRIGNIKRRAKWALKDWHPAKATPGQRAFNNSTPQSFDNTVVTIKKTPPPDSWWTKTRTRAEFNEAWEARLPGMTGRRPTPDPSAENEDRP